MVSLKASFQTTRVDNFPIWSDASPAHITRLETGYTILAELEYSPDKDSNPTYVFAQPGRNQPNWGSKGQDGFYAHLIRHASPANPVRPRNKPLQVRSPLAGRHAANECNIGG